MGYPPGAQNDPRAPYNEPIETQTPCERCDVITDNDCLSLRGNKLLCPDCVEKYETENKEYDD